MAFTFSDKNSWPLFYLIIFRIFFCYYILYLFPFPIYYIPFGNFVSDFINSFWNWLIHIVGSLVFSITKELPLPAGSGDTTYNYIQVFTQLVLAFFVTIIWSIANRKQSNYNVLFSYLLVYVRYFLALTLLSYGFSKLFTNQFSSLSLFDLITPYGNSSPMGLMWNFMEYSDSYTIFAGLSEIVGGLFLLFRRTAVLGALISFGVMLNVFIMNMSYDIPVKLFSAHLMFMALLLLIPHYKNIINFFIKNQPTVPIVIAPYFHRKKQNIIGYFIKGIFLLYIGFTSISNQLSSQKMYGKKAPLPELYGIYEVKQFIRNKDTLAPLTKDSSRWKRLIIDKHNGGIQRMDDKMEYLQYEIDTIKNSIQLNPYQSENYEFVFKFEANLLQLEGIKNADTLQIMLLKKELNDFLLLNRGFNWINEYPLNR